MQPHKGYCFFGPGTLREILGYRARAPFLAVVFVYRLSSCISGELRCTRYHSSQTHGQHSSSENLTSVVAALVGRPCPKYVPATWPDKHGLVEMAAQVFGDGFGGWMLSYNGYSGSRLRLSSHLNVGADIQTFWAPSCQHLLKLQGNWLEGP